MIVALGLTVVLVMGDFDLSIGSMVGFAAGAAIALMVYHDVGWQLAIVLVIAMALGVGIANGLLVPVFGGNSFIMTLGMATILTGLEYAFTSQATVFQGVPQGYIDLGANSIFGLSNQVWIALVVALVLWILLDATELGRFMYAIGGNQEAARLSGHPHAPAADRRLHDRRHHGRDGRDPDQRRRGRLHAERRPVPAPARLRRRLPRRSLLPARASSTSPARSSACSSSARSERG